MIAGLMVVDFSGAWAISSAVVRRNIRTPFPVQPAVIRPWVQEPYFGTVIDGVSLGNLINVAIVPPSPSNGVCWFWATDTKTQGYWDYCKPPH